MNTFFAATAAIITTTTIDSSGWSVDYYVPLYDLFGPSSWWRDFRVMYLTCKLTWKYLDLATDMLALCKTMWQAARAMQCTRKDYGQ